MFGIDFAGFDDGSGLRSARCCCPTASRARPCASPSSSPRGPRSRGPAARSPARATSPPSRRAAAACQAPGVPRPSGARDEPCSRWPCGRPSVLARLPGAAAARRADRAQGDGAHAGPARPDVRRRLPRLGAARRRRREVRAEGGHHPARRRPVGLPARPGRRADPVPRRARRPSRSRPGVAAIDVPGSVVLRARRHCGRACSAR